MYLKQIIATGFKSFADKLDIKLNDKTTCIVGPNGSGKSNVVDAVRWVLGEQSVKSLRGDGSMSDVIFSGSKSRNPLNVASVELIFDNSDHFLNVPYTELSIKRRVYRSGENEYFLNGEKCRLKDLTNLLIDSGMGKESFNIISQGEVEKILSSSPLDRRTIFEEASSILKYKKRKEEALKKLERTNNNIERANDIINELEIQLSPLEEQSKKAKEYLENKKGLDQYEVALLAYDIENFTQELKQAKEKKEKVEQKIITISNESSKYDTESLQDNNNLEKLESKRSSYNQQLLSLTEEVAKIDGERQLLKEQSKTTKEENELKEEIREALNKKYSIESSIEILKEEISKLSASIDNYKHEMTEHQKNFTNLRTRRNMLNSEYSKQDQNLVSINHKISSLQNELDQNLDLPNSVRSVINNTSLSGIHNTISNVIEIDDKYLNALNTAIAANKNFIITENELSAKKAINYLKDNHLGRATFFPLDVIKERYIDNDTLTRINSNPDYIGVLSDLLIYNRKYENIIKNQFGIVLLSPNIDSATRLSHLIRNRYKIITLDGDVINPGGSMSGGSLYKSRSSITIKQELLNLKNKKKTLEEELKDISNEINEVSDHQSKTEEKLFELSKAEFNLKESYDNKNNDLKSKLDELALITKESENLNSIKNNSLNEKEQELIKLYHDKNLEKETVQIKIVDLNKKIDLLKAKIEEKNATTKLNNSTLRSLEKESKNYEITINRLDIKIDNMLNILNSEYELTFEKAKAEYELDIEPEEARKKVNIYRANIKRIGMVNIASIEEYEQVNTRYTFLTNQKSDLLKAEDTLLEIMNEMDEVMKEEFKITFDKIREEFKKVFKELFNGGSADLRLTNPDDLLTTGIDIVASPPGKKLTTISLLSGGEKTLTAISLLFAILNVRSVPFCLFDEVEAALDEANVAQFGKYLDNYKNKTQFLIITHKKKTMEYANTLYGITMQESGVSKLVSVKLEEHEEVL